MYFISVAIHEFKWPFLLQCLVNVMHVTNEKAIRYNSFIVATRLEKYNYLICLQTVSIWNRLVINS